MGTVTLLGIPAVLGLILTSLIIFMILGGGWAYAGSAGCRFVLNAFGITIVAGAALGLLAFLYLSGRRLLRRYHSR